MVCECELISFDGEVIQREFHRSWDLGPVVVAQEPGSNCVSIGASSDIFENSFFQIAELKRILLSGGNLPVIIKFVREVDRGPYEMGAIEFEDQAVFRYIETKFFQDKIVLVFELLTKGKELKIFHGISSNEEQSGNQKPLFWASILKRNIH